MLGSIGGSGTVVVVVVVDDVVVVVAILLRLSEHVRHLMRHAKSRNSVTDQRDLTSSRYSGVAKSCREILITSTRKISSS